MNRDESIFGKGSIAEAEPRRGSGIVPGSLTETPDGASRSTARQGAVMSLAEGSIPRVLVVDDEPDIVEALKLSLEVKGYAVSTAADGLEALQQVQAVRPHVVLLDIHLPKMDGLTVLRHLRRLDPDLEVIMISGIGDAAIRQAALALGAADYLAKPISLPDLERSVARRIITRVLHEALRQDREDRDGD